MLSSVCITRFCPYVQLKTILFLKTIVVIKELVMFTRNGKPQNPFLKTEQDLTLEVLSSLKQTSPYRKLHHINDHRKKTNKENSFINYFSIFFNQSWIMWHVCNKSP